MTLPWRRSPTSSATEGLVDFVNALLVVEQRQRLRLTWERLFVPWMPVIRLAGCRPVRLAAPLRQALAAWAAAVVRLDAVDPVTTELVRLRCARYHDCHT